MLHAQIMAGGTGIRMGNTKLPKQFLVLGNKPIIVHTLEKFTLNNKFDQILVSIPKSWIEYASDILKKYEIDDPRIKIIEGGNKRIDTLKNAIEFVEKNYGLTKDDVLVAHDAVRPFVSKKIIDDNIDMAKKFKCVDTVIPALDTIAEGSDGVITNIPVRDCMYQGQTPQTFNIISLVKAIDELTDDEIDILSDSCKIMLLKGYKVGIAEGNVSNIKITTPFDLKIANAIITSNNLVD